MDPIAGMRLTSLMPAQMPAVGGQGVNAPAIPAQELKALADVSPAGGQSGAQGAGFSDFLSDMVRQVNEKQAAAGQAVEGVLAGENVPLHSAMLAIEEASVSFQLMVEVRNKLMESFQELMRMQV